MIFGVILFVLGLCIGSFINSFLWRYQEKKSFSGRSVCPNCNGKIAWFDNIPVLSWLILKGKCRNCHKTISLQYPIVELMTGLLFFLSIFTIYGQGVSKSLFSEDPQFWSDLAILAISLFIIGILVAISVYDFKTKEIPNGFNIAYIILCTIYLLVLLASSHNIATLDIILKFSGHFLASIISFGIFFSLYYFSKETWMGGGDAKFIFGTGLLLGPAGTFLAIFLASVTGSIFGLSAIALKKTFFLKRLGLKIKNLKSEIPFGPFLALGTYISLVFGPKLIDLYVRIFLGA